MASPSDAPHPHLDPQPHPHQHTPAHTAHLPPGPAMIPGTSPDIAAPPLYPYGAPVPPPPGWYPYAAGPASGYMPYPPYSVYPPYPPYPAPRKTSTWAIASIVCSAAGLAGFQAIAAIPGIIFGHLALKEIKNSGNTLDGHGMAVAGLVIGYISLAISILLVGLYLLFVFGQLIFLSNYSTYP